MILNAEDAHFHDHLDFPSWKKASTAALAFLDASKSYLMTLLLLIKSWIRNPEENLEERPVGKTWLGPAAKSPTEVAV